MKLTQVEKLLEQLVKKNVRLPLALVGESGIGKSAIVKQVAERLGLPCIDLRLATQEPTDLIGIPRSDAKNEKTKWLVPNWFPTDPESKGVLFLDELNRAPTEVRQCVFQLLTDWRMHEHVLPKGWMIAVAMNPEGKSGYQVEVLDPAMINRMLRIEVEFNTDEWLTWAHKTEIHEAVIGFISSQKTLLHKMKEDGPFPTPRTWHYVSNLLKNTELEESCFTEVVSGLVGSEAAAAFSTWMKKHYDRAVSGKEILDDYDKVAEKIKGQSRSANNNTSTDLAALITARHQENKKFSKEEVHNIRQFLFDMPGHDDVRVAFIRKIPPTVLSRDIIGEQCAEAEKLADLFNTITAAADTTKDKAKKEADKASK